VWGGVREGEQELILLTIHHPLLTIDY
jgi:hypothetical protein